MWSRIMLLSAVLAWAGCSRSSQAEFWMEIPFDFQAYRQPMPAGHYRVRLSGPTVLISDSKGRPVVFVPHTVPRRRPVPGRAGLEFLRAGEAYTLSGVWLPESASGRAIIFRKSDIPEAGRSAALQATVFLPQQKDAAAGQTAAESASR